MIMFKSAFGMSGMAALVACWLLGASFALAVEQTGSADIRQQAKATNSAAIHAEIPAVIPAVIPFLSGGIGDDDPVLELPENYNLHLVFATQGSGEYLADIKVLIKDSKGRKVLEANSPGPIFYAKLPTGNYRITVDYQGKSLHKSLFVKDGRRSQSHFYWPGEANASPHERN